MAKGTLGQVVQRAISDAEFRNRLRTDPGGALSGFDLSAEERAALQSGDATKLASFGVDQRMSKAFAMGEAASGVSRLGVGTDLSVGNTITDGGHPLNTNAILDEQAGSGRSALDDQHDAARSAITDDASGSSRSTIDDGDGPFLSGSVDDPVASGRNALGDQHDAARSAVDGGDAAGVGAAPINDAGGPFLSGPAGEGSRNALGDQHDVARSAVDDSTDPNTARLAQVNASYEDSDNLVGGTASDSNATDAFITADESGNDSSATALGGSDSNATSAFMTADEMGRDASRVVDSADVEREAQDDTAMANPEGYEQPDPNAG